MKKPFLIAFFGMLAGMAYAQDTINKYEYFQTGMVGNYIVPTDTIKTIGQAGPNRVWDYSGLSSTGATYTVSIVAPSSTPYASSFPKANIAEKNSDGTYNYIQVSADSSLVWGIYNPGFGLYVSSSPYVAAIRPLSYLDSFSTSDIHQYTVAGYTYKGKGTIKVVADGYGSLKLPIPNATFLKVLRIRMDIIDNDSTNGQKAYNHIRTYTWFDANTHFSLLKIDSTYTNAGTYVSTTTDVKYLSGESAGIEPSARSNSDLKLYQVQNKLFFTATEYATDLQMDIVGTDGKIVLQKSVEHPQNNQEVADISSLKPGIYMARVYSGGKESVLKFYKE